MYLETYSKSRLNNDNLKEVHDFVSLVNILLADLSCNWEENFDKLT